MRRGSVAVFNAQKIRLQGSNRRQEGPYHLCHRQAWPLTWGFLCAGQQSPGKLGSDRGSEEAG